jgi:DNA-binding transcriptional MerR regulator
MRRSACCPRRRVALAGDEFTAAFTRIRWLLSAARALGFGVNSIRALLALARPDHTSCAQARAIAAAHLEEVRAKLADLSRLEAVLSETIAQCEGEKTPACPVIERLGATEK